MYIYIYTHTLEGLTYRFEKGFSGFFKGLDTMRNSIPLQSIYHCTILMGPQTIFELRKLLHYLVRVVFGLRL